MRDSAREAPAGELPDGWVWATLDEVAEINPRADLDGLARDLEVSFVRMAAVEEETGRLNPYDARMLGDVAKGYTRFRDGDILFAKITPCMENGKIALAKDLRNGLGFGSTEFHVIRPRDGVEPEYLLHFLLQPSFRGYAEHNMKGTAGQKRVPPDILRQSVVPIAPISEQRRIVEKIETLLSEIANGAECLDAVDRKLASYRRSVLNQAFTRLIADPTEIGNAGNPISGLPYSRIGDVFQVFTGATPSKKVPDYWGGGIPWVSSGEVSFGNIRETRQTISRRGYDSCSVRLHPIGTVLLAMIGEGKTRGQAAILDIEACNNQNAAAIRVSETDIPPKFLYYYFMYKYEENRRIGSGGNQPALSRSRVQSIKFPHPPTDVMRQCIDYIEDGLSRAHQAEQAVSIPFQHSSALRRSILHSAFSGRLVPQDPSDEPASELLTRIRTERATAPKTSGRRGRPRETSGTSEGATP